MMNRIAPVVAWGVAALCFLGVGAATTLGMLSASVSPSVFSLGTAFILFPLVGAIIISRRPVNTIGRILLGIGCGTATTDFSAGYTLYISHRPGASQLVIALINWLGNLVWPINLGLGIFLILLFPTGQLLSPRWRWVARCLVAGLALNVVSWAFMPGEIARANGSINNPFGIAAIQPVLMVMQAVSNTILLPFVLIAVGGALWRFWRSRDVEREQMKWFALGASTLIVSITLTLIFVPQNSVWANVGFAFGFAMLPITIGIAVLRYRLYDIDVIINRALVYGALTAILGGLYFSVVIGSQSLTSTITGKQIGQQPVVIVLTTLGAAALFQPLRGRIQRVIDRRFYRSKFDAARTIAGFGGVLRTEVEMEQLCSRLLSTVEETVHPAHVSLWLRPPRSQNARPTS
ncbi:MAG TPA: hypothetical protein VF792_11805 [Ktedonobacterales bacterium]